jgi:hypothetical protein
MEWTGRRLLMITLAALLVLSNSPVRAQPDKIILDDSNISERKTRPPVTLPHNRHIEAGLSCKDCHHIYKNGENVLDESKLEEGNKNIHCSVCHGSKSRRNLTQAFHNQCMGCHKRVQKENKKTGPQYCGGCHIRK